MKSQKGVSLIVLLFIIIIIILGTFLIRNILLTKAEKLNEEYEAMFHTITFDTDGGNYISPKKVQTFGGISNVYAEKNGYIFEGWLLDGQLVDVHSMTPLTRDITLKASYRKKENNDTNNYSNNNTSNYNNNSNYYNNSYTQSQPENKKTFNINARKAASLFGKGNITLTVTNYQTETNNSVVGGVKSGQEWVILNIKFENMSNSTVVIDKNDFKIVDGAGKYGYRPYPKHLDTELDLIEIRAGQTASFSVRFVYYQNNEMILRYYNSDLETNSYDEFIELKIR